MNEKCFFDRRGRGNIVQQWLSCLCVMLCSRWSPSYDVAGILTSIQSLLDAPNPNSPANSLAAQLYSADRREYEKRVAAIVEESWLDAEGQTQPGPSSKEQVAGEDNQEDN